jgi:hypothetical protein
MTNGEPKTKKRKISIGTYASFSLQKPIRSARPELPGVFKLSGDALRLLRQNWKVFAGIALLYGLISVALIQTVSSGDVSNAKKAFSASGHGVFSEATSAAGSFLYLLGASGNVTSAAGSYQLILVIITSLALIWALRKTLAGHAIRFRDTFYEGMYPLVPFTTVLFLISLQLLPAILGATAFKMVMTNGITSGPVEVIAWSALVFLLSLLSLYMLTSSVFGLYAVCLPHMTPVKAMRMMRSLVLHRRWIVLRKILFLPVLLVLLSALCLIPLIIWLPSAVAWVFYFLMVIFLAVIHSYLYTLYRALLKE